jgi:hypothetical protein
MAEWQQAPNEQRIGRIGRGGALISEIGSAAGFKKAFDASKEFTDGAAKIKTLLNETQADQLDGSLIKLRETSKSTGESIVNLENSLFNVISAVPALADNIDAAAQVAVIMCWLSR